MVELEVQDYNINYELFLKTKKLLTKLLGDNDSIIHVGSTAIPDMVGKNIIDILIGADDSIIFNKYSRILSNNGYYPGKNSTEIYQFFASSEQETKSGDIHIHLVIKNTQRYNDFIILKNYLLNNKNERDDYSDFKKEILSKTTDRNEYRKIKSKFVSNLLNRARQN